MGKHNQHRTITSRAASMARGAAATIAAGAVLTVAGLLTGAPAHAATRHRECWPMAMRWEHGQHAAMCVPLGRGLRWWSFTLTSSQAWERRMHYLQCAGIGDTLTARRMVFTCETVPGPSWWPGPNGMWTLTAGRP